MANETSLNEAIIEEREQGIREIQMQIGEVNEIFRDLALLVSEQGGLIGQSTLTSHTFLVKLPIEKLLVLLLSKSGN